MYVDKDGLEHREVMQKNELDYHSVEKEFWKVFTQRRSDEAKQLF